MKKKYRDYEIAIRLELQNCTLDCPLDVWNTQDIICYGEKKSVLSENIFRTIIITPNHSNTKITNRNFNLSEFLSNLQPCIGSIVKDDKNRRILSIEIYSKNFHKTKFLFSPLDICELFCMNITPIIRCYDINKSSYPPMPDDCLIEEVCQSQDANNSSFAPLLISPAITNMQFIYAKLSIKNMKNIKLNDEFNSKFNLIYNKKSLEIYPLNCYTPEILTLKRNIKFLKALNKYKYLLTCGSVSERFMYCDYYVFNECKWEMSSKKISLLSAQCLGLHIVFHKYKRHKNKILIPIYENVYNTYK